jgi:3'-phosphoadenosine 5'-phosphosulfate (PAPS) 3'-phosphatase
MPGGRSRIWDSAPALQIINEIGGLYTDCDGAPLKFDQAQHHNVRGAIATIGLDHERALTIIAQMTQR